MEEDVSTDEDQEELMMRKLDEAVPKTVRPRAKALLKLISGSGGAAGWDPDSMELTVGGRKVEGSNILDLAVYAARDKKPRKRGRPRSVPPLGFREFASALRAVNAPRELVRNRKRWPDIYEPYRQHDSEEEEEEEGGKWWTPPKKPKTPARREDGPSTPRRASVKKGTRQPESSIPWETL